MFFQNCPAEGAYDPVLANSREKEVFGLHLLQGQPPLATGESLPDKGERVQHFLRLTQSTSTPSLSTCNDLLQRDTYPTGASKLERSHVQSQKTWCQAGASLCTEYATVIRAYDG